MNKFDRVISTIVLLQTRKIVKAKTISEKYGISLRTVYRDINTLKTAGIPIIGDPGIGYSMMDGYRLPPLMFNEGEAAALLTAEKFIGKLTDQDTQTHYTNALLKIKAILRSTEKQSLEVLDESIVFSDHAKWENKAYLQDLFKSIASKNVVNMTYQKGDGTASERRIEPIGCYHQYNNWYLIAYCQRQNDYRTFKMNRIMSLMVLEEVFDTAHISLQDYIDRQNQEWREQQQFHNIEIAFKESYLSFAEGRKYYFGFVDQIIVGDEVRMKFLNSSLDVMARWLLQFGDQATVLAPIELSDLIKRLSAQLYEHYH